MLVNNESDVPSVFRKALTASILEFVVYILQHAPTYHTVPGKLNRQIRILVPSFQIT